MSIEVQARGLGTGSLREHDADACPAILLPQAFPITDNRDRRADRRHGPHVIDWQDYPTLHLAMVGLSQVLVRVRALRRGVGRFIRNSDAPIRRA